jgi:hypothetical protein
VEIAGLSSGWSRLIAVAVAVVVIIGAIVGITVALSSSGPPTANYCLYSGMNPDTGVPGTLAVQQPSATQSSCNALKNDVQITFANFQTAVQTFAISGTQPAALSGSKVASLKQFPSQSGWFVYSGTVSPRFG